MFDVLSSLKSLLKLDSVYIDNFVFRLHYKVTVIILLTFSILVTSKQYLGDPIDCIVEKDSKVSSNIMDTYCWIHSTYTLPKHFHKVVGKEVVAPGVGPHTDGEDEVRYLQYYQWVCFVLFLQAVIFYIPYYIWKSYEGGKMEKLVQDMSGPVVDKNKKKEGKDLLVEYITANMGYHKSYAIMFFLCEVLNLLNVCWQMYFMDLFLGGMFTTYGLDIVSSLQKDQGVRTDPMNILFPKLTKCTYQTYGSSGSVQVYDSQCVLPLNILNEKIYIFLWFWFIILAIASTLAVFYRLCAIAFNSVRSLLLRRQARIASSQKQVDFISRHCQVGDWFLIYQLGKNLNPFIYKEFIEDLGEHMKGN